MVKGEGRGEGKLGRENGKERAEKIQRMRRVEERKGRRKKWRKKGEIGRRDEKGEGKDSKIQWVIQVNHNMNGRELPAKLLTKNRSISVFSGCTISSPLGKKVVYI